MSSFIILPNFFTVFFKAGPWTILAAEQLFLRRNCIMWHQMKGYMRIEDMYEYRAGILKIFVDFLLGGEEERKKIQLTHT